MKNFNLEKIFYNLSFSLLLGIFVIFCLSFSGFILNIPINPVYPILGLITVLSSIIYYGKKEDFNKKEYTFSFLLLFISIFIFYFLSETFWDYSYDGREYHQAGIILLKNGYNPIYNTAQAVFDKIFNFYYEVPVWVDVYPKFSEILSANIFCLTNKIESAKLINYVISLIVFCYSSYVLSRFFKNKYTFLYSLLITANPVVISGISTFCNDGLVYNFFVISLLSIIDMAKTKEIKPQLMFVMSIIMLSNIKLGGIFYGILLIIYAFKSLKKPILTCLVILIMFILSGINPYFTNVANGKHPLHPILGKEKVDIMTHNTPGQFLGKSMGFKLFWANFGKPDNFLNIQNKPIYFKLPFTFTQSEINSKVWAENTRIGGFGVFWSGIILLSLIGLFFVKKEGRSLILFLLITVLLMPNNWWARYVPQFYLIPVFISLFMDKKVFANFLMCLLLSNSLILFYSIVGYQVLPFYSFCQKTIPVFDAKMFSLYDLEKFNEKGIEVKFNEN